MFAHRSLRRWPASAAIALCALSTWVPAHRAAASNCAPIPVSVEFSPTACIEAVDRTQTPILEIPYTHPPDQLAMVQPGQEQWVHFVAFSKRPSTLPPWLSTAQVEAARQVFAGSDCEVGDVPEDQVLETNPDLAGTWFSVAGPLPVTADQAAMGLAWNLDGIPDGTYLLYAYVDAGRFNAWFPYDGAFKVTAGAADPTAAAPSLYIPDLSLGQTYFPGQQYQIKICTDAMDGTRLDLAWETSPLPGETPLTGLVAACYPVESPVMNVPFVLPQDTADAQVRFVGTVTDPMGRTMETFTSYRLVGPSTAECLDDDVPIKPSHCSEFTPAPPGAEAPDDRCGGTGGTTSGGEATETDGSGSTSPQSGCGCRSGGRAPFPWWAAAPLAWLGLRRRRTRARPVSPGRPAAAEKP